MKPRTLLVAAALASAAFAMPAAYADSDPSPHTSNFMKMSDKDKDGMISKEEAMKMVEKAFDKADTKKMGKLDKKQVEQFLKMLMDPSPGG